MNIFLQSYLSRHNLSSFFPASKKNFKKKILNIIYTLLQAMINIFSSKGYLIASLACIELLQMFKQQQWHNQTHLLQLPHMTTKLLQIESFTLPKTILDFAEMNDELRMKFLSHDCQFNKEQINDIALFCNNFRMNYRSYHVT